MAVVFYWNVNALLSQLQHRSQWRWYLTSSKAACLHVCPVLLQQIIDPEAKS